MPKVDVVGIGADGWDGVREELRALIESASVVLGGTRHLAMLPPANGQRRLRWPSPLREELPPLVAELSGSRIVALASGDPLVSGIGSTLVELLGAENVAIHPAPSSVALARAELGWSSESCVVVSLVGRDPALVARELAPGRRVLVLSSDGRTPAQVASLLTETGFGESALHVLGNLGGQQQSRIDTTAGAWSGEAPRLNIIGIEVAGPVSGGWAAGLPDDTYENDGQLTKRDLRASALARLLPVPGQHLWDVGAGAGSVGIEWLRAHPTCRATAVEADGSRAARIGRNARRLGVPGLEVVWGAAPAALQGLPAPDAVFVGGGATVPGVLDACLSALRPGGRLVAHGVTLETESVLAQAYRDKGGELTRIGVETAAPIGSFTGWTPARAVTQWALTIGS